MPQGWPGDDAMIEQYLGKKRIELAKPLVSGIRELGAKAESVVREGDDVEDDLMALATARTGWKESFNLARLLLEHRVDQLLVAVTFTGKGSGEHKPLQREEDRPAALHIEDGVYEASQAWLAERH